MVEVSNATRVVFPEVNRTKGDVVAYYERIAPRLLPHVIGRPLSMKRFPKGLAAPGFFQKNVPPHYPSSIARFAVPRSAAATAAHAKKSAKKRSPRTDDAGAATTEANETVYPLVSEPEHLAYLANQGAIEMHVTASKAATFMQPDRFVIDLDPPADSVALVRNAARLTRDLLAELGLDTVPVATGSKGYHVVANLTPTADATALAHAAHKTATLLAARHPDTLTIAFRVAARGARAFVDWLRMNPSATFVAPFSLRARPRATVAVPLDWDELDQCAPDAFTIADVDRLLARPDPLVALPASDAATFVQKVEAAFEKSGLVLENFDRFRS